MVDLQARPCAESRALPRTTRADSAPRLRKHKADRRRPCMSRSPFGALGITPAGSLGGLELGNLAGDSRRTLYQGLQGCSLTVNARCHDDDALISSFELEGEGLTSCWPVDNPLVYP